MLRRIGAGLGLVLCTGVVVNCDRIEAATKGHLAYELTEQQRSDLRLKPGLWKLKTKLTGRPDVISTICLSEPANEIYIDPLHIIGMTSCPVLSMKRMGSEITVNSKCNLGNDTQQNASVVRKLESETSFHQTSIIKVTPEKYPPQQSETFAQWLGNCRFGDKSGDIRIEPDDSMKLNLFVMLTPPSE